MQALARRAFKKTQADGREPDFFTTRGNGSVNNSARRRKEHAKIAAVHQEKMNAHLKPTT